MRVDTTVVIILSGTKGLTCTLQNSFVKWWTFEHPTKLLWRKWKNRNGKIFKRSFANTGWIEILWPSNNTTIRSSNAVHTCVHEFHLDFVSVLGSICLLTVPEFWLLLYPFSWLFTAVLGELFFSIWCIFDGVFESGYAWLCVTRSLVKISWWTARIYSILIEAIYKLS